MLSLEILNHIFDPRILTSSRKHMNSLGKESFQTRFKRTSAKTVVRVKRQYWTREQGNILFLSLLTFSVSLQYKILHNPNTAIPCKKNNSKLRKLKKGGTVPGPFSPGALVGRIAMVSRTFSSHFSFVSGIIECLPNAFKNRNRISSNSWEKYLTTKAKQLQSNFHLEILILGVEGREKPLNTSVWT